MLKVKNKKSKKLTAQVILYMFLSSFIFMLILVVIQLYFTYQKEMKLILEQKKQIENSYLPSLSNQLWVGAFELINVQIKGITQLPYICYANIEYENKQNISAGTSKSHNFISYDFPLKYKFNNTIFTLGSLHIEICLDTLYNKLSNRLFFIVGNQIIVIFLVSFFGFIIFQQLIMRHLYLISKYTRQFNINSLSNILKLKRIKKDGSHDELDNVVNGINQMRSTIKENIFQLKDEIKIRKTAEEKLKNYQHHLEDIVEERTYDLQEKNKKIMDSLNYAKIIQRSLLPALDIFNNYISDGFVIWHPRDIVGGDILFSHVFEDGIVCGVIDCTGHGIPGAFMSMIASSGLRKIVSGDNCYDPAKILKKLNFFVKTSLQQDTEHALSDDGMDVSLCYLNFKKQSLTFAGAKLPLIYIYNNKLTLIKGDKQSIGYRRSNLNFNFTNHIIDLKKGISFYLYTDGITDQLGGERRRIFGTKRLKQLLLDNYKKPFREQRKNIIKAFDSYKGEEERQDDVTIAGCNLDQYLGKL